MKVGFIGLGNLGIAIAENLLEFQMPLYVYNRTASKAIALKDKGAEACSSIKELASRCDVVFSIVSDDNAVKEITEGNDGIAANLREGGIHISMSTILPTTSVALSNVHKQHGSIYLACPVMARPEVARAKKINFLISGDANAIQTVKPLLQQAGGVNTWEFGNDVGAANVAKLCSNYLILAAMEAMSEGIYLAQQSGIDANYWMQMLTQTYFNAPAYINYSRIILEEAFKPAGFSLQLGLKDMNLVLQQAKTVEANMPVGKQLQNLLQHAMKDGLGDYDVTAVAMTVKGKQLTE
jgi:3-hydroxyisobutyrate dehydrogenase-like beta-hydroxyacid dehydrogenase